MEDILKQILSKLNKIEENQIETNNRLDNLESQTVENTQILKALEHNSQVHKAEMDNLTHSTAELSGDVKSIKSAVVKGEKAYDFLQNFDKFSSPEN